MMDGFDGFDPIPLAPLDDQPEPRRRVDLVPAASLRIEPIRWLWRHWLAAGKLHILAGAPGVAKTTLALSLIAVVSRGGAWPDGSPAAPGRCVIWSGEDDPADTLAPRLIAAGADMTRVHFVGDVLDLGERRAFDPAADMPVLAEAIRELRDVRLLLIDPIVSAVAGDDHKNAATRRSLQPLKDLAAATGAAIVGISHFRKGAVGDPLERVNGSVAFGALARIVWIAAKEQPGEDDAEPGRIFARAKSNIGPEDGAFRYRLRSVALHEHPGVEAGAIEWLGAIAGSARDILAEVEASRDEDATTAHSEAEAFLFDLLAEGPVETKEIKRRAGEAGHAWATIRRAKTALGVVSRKHGMDGGWCWTFPEGAHENPKAPKDK